MIALAFPLLRGRSGTLQVWHGTVDHQREELVQNQRRSQRRKLLRRRQQRPAVSLEPGVRHPGLEIVHEWRQTEKELGLQFSHTELRHPTFLLPISEQFVLDYGVGMMKEGECPELLLPVEVLSKIRRKQLVVLEVPVTDLHGQRLRESKESPIVRRGWVTVLGVAGRVHAYVVCRHKQNRGDEGE